MRFRFFLLETGFVKHLVKQEMKNLKGFFAKGYCNRLYNYKKIKVTNQKHNKYTWNVLPVDKYTICNL